MKKNLICSGLITAALMFAVVKTNAQTDWHITGNAGTSASANFLGTTDNLGLKIRTNNTNRVIISNKGKVALGNFTPVSKLDILGATTAADTVPVVNVIVKKTGNFDVVGVHAESQPALGFGVGMEGLGNFIGVFGNGGTFGLAGISPTIGVDGEAIEDGNLTQLTGVQGLCTGGDLSVGVYGSCTGSNNNYGVYGDQQDTAIGTDYALVGIGDVFGWRFFQASDRKLKKNVETYSGALAKISQLNASTYTFDHAKYPGMALPGGKQIGFMADNVEQVFPELIKTGDLPAGATRDTRGKPTYHQIENVKTVNYMGLIPVLAEAIKEQKAIVDAKDAVIADLNARLTALEAKVSGTSSAKLSSTSTVDASLEQNTPNPFSQSTQIRYSVPANYNSAKITITSIDGKSVRNYTISGTGKGQITLNANELSVGSYTYSLNVDGKVVDTKTLVLTK
ncbi:MAG TPA: tail fiber domain-containing protein [Bacteroidia bacterium]|nr:tail fiber domain-containing protein [Bacteroidia bacterium]